jgi:hypothetical protein
VATFNIGVSVHLAMQAGPQLSGGSGTVSFASGLHKVRDMEHGGDGAIHGTVKVKGTPNNVPDTPVSRKVRLIRDVDALCIRETWSDPVTGAYTFAEIDRTVSYTVLSYDYTESFRAVVADRVLAT